MKGPFNHQAVIDFTGKILKINNGFQELFRRKPGELILGPSSQLSEETKQKGFRVLREALFRKHYDLEHFELKWKDGRSAIISGQIDVIDCEWGIVDKALEVKGKIHEYEEINNHN